MSAAEAEAEILKNFGPISLEERIEIAAQMEEQAAQLYASAWARCPEIKMPPDPQLN